MEIAPNSCYTNLFSHCVRRGKQDSNPCNQPVYRLSTISTDALPHLFLFFTVREFSTGCNRVILFYYADMSECHGVEWLVTFNTLQYTFPATSGVCVCISVPAYAISQHHACSYTELCLPACHNIHVNKSFNLS